MKRVTAGILATVALALTPTVALAEHHEELTEPLSGFRADFAADLAGLKQKVLSLAKAVPADKYDWAPTPEVRNLAASYVHMAQSSHQILRALGVESPPGVADMEQEITEKDEVVEALEVSFAAIKRSVEQMGDDELDRKVPFFGREWSKRQVLMLLSSHAHEHLGQSIVYARSVGVVPPWSRPRDDSGGG